MEKMKFEVYERLDLVITEFDAEDVITTSGFPSGQSSGQSSGLPSLDEYEGGVFG